MKKIYRCLAAALILTLVFTSSALAASSLTLNAFEASAENGRLYVVAYADNSNEADLNFTAKTENGDLLVESVVARRNEDITWFFVVDYDSDSLWSTEPIMRTERRILTSLKNIVRDGDQGMLVLAAEKPQIGDFESANVLRATLDREPTSSDTSQLGNTLRTVMDYIDNNWEIIQNPTVVVVTSTRFDRDMIDGTRHDSFLSVLTDHRYITTHIICTAPQDDDYPVKGWRTNAAILAGLADNTVGGRGVVTKIMTEGAADDAVGEIRAWENGLVRLCLNPQSLNNIGKKVTLTQTTKSSKTFVASMELPDDVYNVWKEYWEHPIPTDGPVPTYKPFTSKSSFILIDNNDNPNAITSSTKTSVPWEMIVAIAVGVLVLALLIVLLVTRTRGKKQQPSTQYTSVVQPQSRGTTVVLQDASGNRYTGTMKNGRLTIGRYAAKGAMLVIPNDAKLSGLHATLTKQGDGLTIVDNNSTNGTKVNGAAISGAVTLRQNDSVTMGSSTYRVTWR